jgi:hypothetical protein
MKSNPRIFGVSLALTLTALLGLGCAQMGPLLAAFGKAPVQLEARGPGAVFGRIDAAAVDALTYAYLQAQAAHDTERMRGGTVHRVDGGFSYGEIQVAGPLLPNQITYALEPQDVARFQIYPRVSDHDVNRAAERPTRVDRRSVSFVDPLHRPLYILHPSLVIRVYRGEGDELVDVADLRRPQQGLLIAGE